jgi:hypothetical protein
MTFSLSHHHFCIIPPIIVICSRGRLEIDHACNRRPTAAAGKNVETRLFGRLVARRYGGNAMTALPGLTYFLARLAKDQRGGHTAQMALSIGLFALVAAFGFFFLGDAITEFFVALSRPFNNAWN